MDTVIKCFKNSNFRINAFIIFSILFCSFNFQIKSFAQFVCDDQSHASLYFAPAGCPFYADCTRNTLAICSAATFASDCPDTGFHCNSGPQFSCAGIYAFYAGNGPIEFNIESDTCSSGQTNAELIVALYETCPIETNQYDCLDSDFSAGNSAYIYYPNPIPGKVYYLVIDPNEICIISIYNNSAPFSFPEPEIETTTCLGIHTELFCTIDGSATMNVDIPNLANFADVNYLWSLNGIPQPSVSQSSFSLNLTPGDYLLCLEDATSPCESYSQQICKTIQVYNIPDEDLGVIEVCTEDFENGYYPIDWLGDYLYEGGIFYHTETTICGCVYQQQVELIDLNSALDQVYNFEVCTQDLTAGFNPEEWPYQDLTEAGSYSNTIFDANDCQYDLTIEIEEITTCFCIEDIRTFLPLNYNDLDSTEYFHTTHSNLDSNSFEQLLINDSLSTAGIFDSTYFQVEDLSNLGFEEFGISVWAYFDTTGYSFYTYWGERAMSIFSYDRRIQLRFMEDLDGDHSINYMVTNPEIDSSSISFPAEPFKWYHIIANYSKADNGLMELYIDGNFIGEDSIHFLSTPSSPNYEIGSRVRIETLDRRNYLNGKLENFVIWKRPIESYEAKSVCSLPLDCDLFADVVLEEKWIDLQLSPLSSAIQLDWQVPTNRTAALYKIYHKEEGGAFNMIDQVEWEDQAEFKYLHLDPAFGTNYYKIEQIIQDQSFFSDLESIDFNYSEAMFKVFPNPAKDEIRLNLDFDLDTTYHIEIFDKSGRLIDQKMSVQNSNLKMNISQLNTGLYFIKIVIADQIFIEKLMVH